MFKSGAFFWVRLSGRHFGYVKIPYFFFFVFFSFFFSCLSQIYNCFVEVKKIYAT